MDRFDRVISLIGKEKFQKINDSKVIIFGIGGVGSYVCESLARSGVTKIGLVDKDTVEESNINRQIIALNCTIGQSKVDVMAQRIKDINPDCLVNTYNLFYLPATADEIDLSQYDYVVDAMDNVTAKLELICRAKAKNVKIISSMGTANKLTSSALEVTDIYKTSVCPLARVMRRELKKRDIKSLTVVYSKEEPQSKAGTMIFVPATSGLLIAETIIKDIIKD